MLINANTTFNNDQLSGFIKSHKRNEIKDNFEMKHSLDEK